MNKLPNYIMAFATNTLLHIGLREAGVPFYLVFFIGVLFWLWISDLIDKRR